MLLQSIQLALLKYSQREGPVLKCYTLSVKETKQVNEHTRRSLASELGMKCNAILQCLVTILLITGQREKRTIPEMSFAVPKVGNNSEKAHIEYVSSHFVTSSTHGTRNPPNVKPAKCLSWQILQILCLPIFLLYGRILHM